MTPVLLSKYFSTQCNEDGKGNGSYPFRKGEQIWKPWWCWAEPICQQAEGSDHQSLCHPLNEYSAEQDQFRDQIFSSTKTQTAGLKELSYIGLNIRYPSHN